MLNKQSFNLNNEENKSKSNEKLYQPKKFRWCKFVVVPCLIGFILLLILTNVDFTGHAYDKTWLLVTDSKIIIGEKSVDMDKLRQIKASRGLTCISSDNSCTLACEGGNVNNMYKQLEPLYPLCGTDMQLFLQECSFPAGTMKSSFLQGNFRLKTLAIIDCNLASIQALAFRQNSVVGLKTLHLINTQFVSLSRTTFEGLAALDTLNITNKISGSYFKGEQFLEPLAGTLKTFRMVHESKVGQNVDPHEWLQDTNMTNLQALDFSGNNFSATLTAQTFANTSRVVTLNLANCSLSHLPANIFDEMISTLQHLDLSRNQFTTLDSGLLGKLSGLNSLSMGYNNWDCSWSNCEMWKSVRDNVISIVTDRGNSKCFTPLELRDESIFSVNWECGEETIGTDHTEELSTWTTTASVSETTGITVSTEDNTTETREDDSIETSETISGTTIEITEVTTSPTEFNSTTQEPIMETTHTDTSTSRITSTTTNTPPSTTTTNTPTSTTPTTSTKTTTNTAPTEEPYSHIRCYDPLSGNTVAISLYKAQTQFTITPHSATSVRVIVPELSITFDIIYFTDYRHGVQWTRNQPSNQRSGYTLLVSDLAPGTVYVFCLVPMNNVEISPFDCKSFYVRKPEAQAWIMNEDQKWIIALTVLGVCLCLFIGIIAIFLVVRMRNRRKEKKQLLRSRRPRDSGVSYFDGRVSEVPLSDLRKHVNVSQHHSADVRMPPRPDPSYILPERNYYEEVEREV